MKFNMGSGRRKRPGYVNVDAEPQSEPDEVVDLEVTPWPWPDSCASEVLFNHSLEHMGGDPKVFLAIMSELYRIAKNGCVVQINVPHPRHDNFIGDPTHVRAITPKLLELFDQTRNRQAEEANGAQTPFGLYLGVDFELVKTAESIAEPYWSQFQAKTLTRERLDELRHSAWNVIKAYQFTLRVRKP
jgi:hypothetical protein